jgi:hypothetical protein
MNELMEQLKRNKDYIILDTPPVGLVSPWSCQQFADVTFIHRKTKFLKRKK